MKILVDTNIVLDLLLDRYPYSEDAAMLFTKIEKKELTGFICATSVTTINYFLQKSLGKKIGRESIKELLSLFEIAEVNKKKLLSAQKSKFDDFEDAVIYEAARTNKVTAIITRNIKDFSYSTIKIYTPKRFLTAKK